jgi:hypothetical protein
MNTQFVFESKQKTVLLSLMALGVICLGLTWAGDSDEFHTRFWTNVLHNSVFFTGISAVAMFMICAKITMYGGWGVVFKRLLEGFSLFMMVGIALMGIIAIGNFAGYHHLYHWTDAQAVAADKILTHKSGFLNSKWFMASVFLFLAAWAAFAYKLRQLSLQEDEEGNYGAGDFAIHRTMRKYAAAFLPIFGFTSAVALWLWVMSIDAHWFSTMFAWYCTASLMVSMVCVTILIILYLKSKGYMEYITPEHFHDLGKFTFAFSIFWTYLWFSQFMLIWYANIGEETTYFKLRMDNYPVLYWGNLLMNFVLPFFILIRNDTKRKFGSIGFAAGLVLFGHWWDFFQMIKPSAMKNLQEHQAHAAHAAGGHSAAAHGAEHATVAAHGAEHVVDSVVAGAEHAATTAAHGTEHAAVGHEVVQQASTFIEGFSLPGLLEMGTFLGFAGLFVYFVFSQLTKASLLPKNDPYIQESLTHHVV